VFQLDQGGVDELEKREDPGPTLPPDVIMVAN